VNVRPNPPAFEAVARCVRAVTRVVLALSAVLFCVALTGLTVDIVMRYSVNSSVRGMQEIVNLLFGWIYMLGVAALYARKGDAAITFFVRAMPAQAQNIVALLVSLIIAAGMAIVFIETTGIIQSQAAITSAELGIPEPLRYIPLAVATISIVITSLIDVWACALWAMTGHRPVVWSAEELDSHGH
jgi:TRAP-type C4-dicarboxylate transport system permease small subunit